MRSILVSMNSLQRVQPVKHRTGAFSVAATSTALNEEQSCNSHRHVWASSVGGLLPQRWPSLTCSIEHPGAA
jgi:hypothetical protein